MSRTDRHGHKENATSEHDEMYESDIEMVFMLSSEREEKMPRR